MRYVSVGVAAVLLTLLNACGVGTPGHISKSTSQFDNSSQLMLEPAWVGSMTGLKMGLVWNSKMPPDTVLLVAIVQGLNRISDGKSLHFNINGEFLSLTSIDASTNYQTENGGLYLAINTYIPPSNWSSKRYVINRELLDKLVEAEKVVAKIDLDRSAIEGDFTIEAPTTARPAFREFRSKLAAF